MLIYASGMKDKTIPWEIIEARLNKLGKNRSWFETTMGVEKNVVTNWKSRGVPKRIADELGVALQTSADFLLGVTEDDSGQLPRKNGSISADEIPEAYIDGADIALLIELFRKSTRDGRAHIIESAEVAEKIVVSRGRKSAKDQAQ